MNNRNTLIALAVASALAAGSAAADNAAGVDTSEWKCESCPFQKEYEAEAEAGLLYVDDDSAKFGEYNGLDEKGAYVDVAARGGSRAESGTYYRYELDGLGVDPQAEAVFGKEGVFAATLSYDEIPHAVWDTTETPYDRSGKDTLVLPAGWVRSGSTAGMTALAGSLAPVDIGTDRTILGAGLQYLFGANLELFADYSRQEIEGNKLSSANFLFSSLQLPEPVDSAQDQFEIGAAYRWKAGFARLAWYGSVYDNSLSGLTFDNPYTPYPTDTVQGRKATAPDNKAQSFSLDGNFLLPWWKGVLSYRLAEGSMDQDEAFLPFSTSAALAGAATLPRGDLGGDVSTSHYRAALSLKPHPRLRARFGYRYDERDDGTAVFLSDYVESDSLLAPGIPALRYSYERTRYDGYGEAKILDWLFLGVGGEFDQVDRTNQEATRTTEEGSYAQLRMRPWGSIELSARYGESHIDADEAVTVQAIGAENPLLRKFNQADRDRDYAEARFSWAPGKLALSLEGSYAFDAYRLSPLGLKSGRDYRYAGTLSWAAADNVSLYLTGSLQNIVTEQASEERFPTSSVPWSVSHEDEFSTAGGGVVWKDVAGKVDLAIDYTYAKSQGAIDTTVSGDSSAGAFPKLQTELNSLRVRADYDVNTRLSVGVAWTWEDYSSSDWQLAGVEPATLSNLLGMGADPYDYSVNVIGVSFRYRFGGGPIEEESE